MVSNKRIPMKVENEVGSAEEKSELLGACSRLGRKPSLREIEEWKRGRGNFGFWPKRERVAWLEWAVGVVNGGDM